MTERSSEVRILAPAKINLFLRVLERMESGYHALETLFCAVSLCDEVGVRRSTMAGVRLTVEGDADLGPADRNLAVRAATAFLRRIGSKDGIEIRLLKRIPAAAGLGGGSSDAAATLRALDALFQSRLSREELMTLGLELGSDVPFFLSESPLALAWGRGERVLSLPALPQRLVVIAHPGAAMPTPAAFVALADARGPAYRPTPAHLSADELTAWDPVAALSANDFEPVATTLLPALVPALTILREAGAAPALLSGSGAAIFGIFESEDRAAAAAGRLQRQGLRTWTVETLGTLPSPQVDPTQENG